MVSVVFSVKKYFFVPSVVTLILRCSVRGVYIFLLFILPVAFVVLRLGEKSADTSKEQVRNAWYFRSNQLLDDFWAPGFVQCTPSRSAWRPAGGPLAPAPPGEVAVW